MSEAKKENREEKPNISKTHITLVVKSQDYHDVIFRLKRSSKLKILMDAYCVKYLLASDSIVFLYDGNRIKPCQTPDEFGMEDGDTIDAMFSQIGGAVDGF